MYLFLYLFCYFLLHSHTIHIPERRVIIDHGICGLLKPFKCFRMVCFHSESDQTAPAHINLCLHLSQPRRSLICIEHLFNKVK